MQYSKKTKVCFTWDDNFIRHYTHIAPLFEKYNYHCTFYINPNDEDLDECLTHKYKDLYSRGFELGSHGFNHINMMCLDDYELIDSIEKSQKCFLKKLGISPLTFAFPYHKYDDRVLNLVKRKFIETRNTLSDSIRFSLKTKTNAINMTNALAKAITQKKQLVISGHSIFTKREHELELSQGYEPVIYEELEVFISKLSSYNVDVETFYSIVRT